MAETSAAMAPRGVGRSDRLVVVALGAVSIAATVAAWVLGPAVDPAERGEGAASAGEFLTPLMMLALSLLGGLVVVRGRSPAYGWLMLGAGALSVVVELAGRYSFSVLAVEPAAGAPALASAAGWVQDLWMVYFVFLLLLLPALFPDGRALPRWRWPVRAVAGGWGLLISVFMVAERPLSNRFETVADPPTNPIGVLPVPDDVINTVWLLMMVASVVVGVGSVVTRWRSAAADLRQQFKWVLLAFGVLGSTALFALADTVLVNAAGVDLGLGGVIGALMAAALLFLVVALGLAVLRHRLYEIDLIISRTVVYGVMTALVLAVYVAVVAGVGVLVAPDGRLGLSLVATGVVAVAFSPVRDRIQRIVNRLMFGRRDDPYSVLSELGRLLVRSGEPEATLQEMVETISDALRLPGVAFELDRDGRWETRAAVGTVDGRVETIELGHQGKAVGRLVVAPRSQHEELNPDDRRLLEDIAHQAAALSHAVRLSLALQRSREQLVMAREEERRRLRRDLHDGLGPTLASQTFWLDAILRMLPDDQSGAAELLGSLKRQNQELVADIRRLVYELRPPALDELGLVGAIAAHAGQMGSSNGLDVQLTTDPEPLGDLSAAAEVAAYRIASEAMTNVVRHAAASKCDITLILGDDSLEVRVVDDGRGIRAEAEHGVGMTSMRERAEELGGALSVGLRKSGGTEVVAVLPVPGPHGWAEPRATPSSVGAT